MSEFVAEADRWRQTLSQEAEPLLLYEELHNPDNEKQRFAPEVSIKTAGGCSQSCASIPRLAVL